MHASFLKVVLDAQNTLRTRLLCSPVGAQRVGLDLPVTPFPSGKALSWGGGRALHPACPLWVDADSDDCDNGTPGAWLAHSWMSPSRIVFCRLFGLASRRG